MSELFPPIEPHATGMLDVGEGNLVHWEVCGNPDGKPAVVVDDAGHLGGATTRHHVRGALDRFARRHGAR